MGLLEPGVHKSAFLMSISGLFVIEILFCDGFSLLIKRELSLISVGHRPSLKEFHNNVLALNGKGNWQLLPTKNYNFDN